MVDQRGFPEQLSIVQFMTRNVHSLELQDFIEEAVVECFHYLDPDTRQNKCYFSENLLACLIDKGKEDLSLSRNRFLRSTNLTLHSEIENFSDQDAKTGTINNALYNNQLVHFCEKKRNEKK